MIPNTAFVTKSNVARFKLPISSGLTPPPYQFFIGLVHCYPLLLQCKTHLLRQLQKVSVECIVCTTGRPPVRILWRASTVDDTDFESLAKSPVICTDSSTLLPKGVLQYWRQSTLCAPSTVLVSSIQNEITSIANGMPLSKVRHCN